MSGKKISKIRLIGTDSATITRVKRSALQKLKFKKSKNSSASYSMRWTICERKFASTQ